jgi:hypothetical protein
MLCAATVSRSPAKVSDLILQASFSEFSSSHRTFVNSGNRLKTSKPSFLNSRVNLVSSRANAAISRDEFVNSQNHFKRSDDDLRNSRRLHTSSARFHPSSGRRLVNSGCRFPSSPGRSSNSWIFLPNSQIDAKDGSTISTLAFRSLNFRLATAPLTAAPCVPLAPSLYSNF